jgi:hypothetical protein
LEGKFLLLNILNELFADFVGGLRVSGRLSGFWNYYDISGF